MIFVTEIPTPLSTLKERFGVSHRAAGALNVVVLRETRMRNASRRAAIAVALFVSGLPFSAVAQTQQFLVDCTAGMTISAALNKGDSRKPVVLTIRGQCNENVSITRDDVTLRGDSQSWGVINGTSTTQPTVEILAHRVTVDWLTITGGRDGIMIHGASNAAVLGSTIHHTGADGIRLLGGHARILNNLIQYAGGNGIAFQSSHALLSNNIIRYNAAAGVFLQQTSNVNAVGNTISANGSNGLELKYNSHGSLYANSITGNGTNVALLRNGIDVHYSTVALFEGNNVSNNNGVGVLVYAGRASLTNSTIAANGFWGLSADQGSSVDITGGTVTGNTRGGIAMRMRSNLQLAGASITTHTTAYGVRLRFGSGLLAVAPASDLSNNGVYGLVCEGAESSVSDTALLNGVIDPNCSGF